MDLPTYTNIWRIEKRLYKLYDLKLPMPLPIVQIGVFAGVTVPWIMLLKLIGVPFRAPWHVLYFVPPGLVTWASTRPVIEGKRLTELLLSQLRYLTEPRTLCRLAPTTEPAEVSVAARVWHRASAPATGPTSERESAPTPVSASTQAASPSQPPAQAIPSPVPPSEPRPSAQAAVPPAELLTPSAAEPTEHGDGQATRLPESADERTLSLRAVSEPPVPPQPVNTVVPLPRPPAQHPGRFEGPAARRVEAVVHRDRRSSGWRRMAHVTIGSTSRDDASAQHLERISVSFSGNRRVLVLGCTGGAGQSVTALLLGQVLAKHRKDRILAVDANPSEQGLAKRVKIECPETLGSLLANLHGVNAYLAMRAYTSSTPAGLEVIAADQDMMAAHNLADHDYDRMIRLLDRYYKIILVDPAAPLVARVLSYADQLVLVAPASADAPRAVAMTLEWLDAQNRVDLRNRAVTVINGVSRRSLSDVQRAEAAARGRCRAIVRVPWDHQLAPGGAQHLGLDLLRAATQRAYLALGDVVTRGFSAEQAVQEMVR